MKKKQSKHKAMKELRGESPRTPEINAISISDSMKGQTIELQSSIEGLDSLYDFAKYIKQDFFCNGQGTAIKTKSYKSYIG